MKPARRQFVARTSTSLLIWAILWGTSSFGGNFFQGVSPTNQPVPGGIVYYQFDGSVTPAEQPTYLAGLEEWELAANVQFIPYTDQTNWIIFQYSTNAQIDTYNVSSVPWTVTVSSLSRAQVCHEMGHVFGFAHENIRTDKNTYITVVTNNVYPASNIYWFTIDPTTQTNGPYDYRSVMHLGDNFSSISTNLYTQLANPPYQSFQPFMGDLCISAGDRAALAYIYGPPKTPLTNIVTTTSDVGPGSLRAAIYYATDHPGTTVKFNIPTNDSGYSNGVYTIHLTGFLPPLVVNGTIIDGSTQPGFSNRPIVIIDGSQIIPQAYPPGQLTGLLIYAGNCQVKSLSFQNCGWNGITLSYPGASNNLIAGCWCGPDYTGTNAAPNALQGILIYNGASSNTVGGLTSSARNVLSGNVQYGVFISGSNTCGNVVCGNYIGTDYTGTKSLSNGYSGVIVTDGAYSNVIGGVTASARNILSGNSNYGAYINMPNTTNNVVEGNYIGTDITGTNPLPNDFGGAIITAGAWSNTIGGAVAGAGNILSGNTTLGVWVDSSNNLVQGNWIGLDATGGRALPNTFLGMYLIYGAQNNSVISNVISGNSEEGLRLESSGTSGNVVQGNYMGTDATGTFAVPNNYAGLTFFFGPGPNLAGGATAATRNIVSGNGSYGVVFGNAGTASNVVEGNYIGLNAAGTAAIPNWTGVLISDESQSNVLDNNIISGNYDVGLWITDTNTTGNIVQGNIIGLAPNASTPLANGWIGIFLTNAAQSNILGLALNGSGAGNVVACNDSYGIALYNTNTTGNTIRGNNIFSNSSIGIELAGGTQNSYGVTANHVGGAVPGPNDLQNYPVITNAVTSGSSTIISGTLNSTANRTFLIDCYRNVSPDPSGFGQGQYYLGSVRATTGATGNASFTFTASGNFAGQYFTATATDDAVGDTSEFAGDVLATNGPAPPSFRGPYSESGGVFSANVSVAIGQSYHIQMATNLALNPIPWVNLTNFVASATNYSFSDKTATNSARFYRVTSP